jgi:hypothetical protein
VLNKEGEYNNIIIKRNDSTLYSRFTQLFPKVIALQIFFILIASLATEKAHGVNSTHGFTYHRTDGNRFLQGKGSLPDIPFRDIRLHGKPVWIVALPFLGGSVWAVVLENGRVSGFHISEDEIRPYRIRPVKLPPGMPPLLTTRKGEIRIFSPSVTEKSFLTHPVIFEQTGRTALLYRDGRIVLKNGHPIILDINALPDARILYDENGRMLILTGRSDQYKHGVLGDLIEATSVTLIHTRPAVLAKRIITLHEDNVIEGIAPLWSDMDGDGRREIVLTISDAQRGARYAVFDEDGELIATSSAVGQGYRWRHQIAVAPFGPDGGTELAGVLTPHIGGVVEFYRLQEGKLVRTAQVKGFSSHLLGSRNLDMALAADFDGDGRIELLAPLSSHDKLGAVRRNLDSARTAWTIPVGGKISTNIAAVVLQGRIIGIGIGREDGFLRLWIP